MADDLRAELDLDITRALQRVNQLEQAVSRATSGRLDVDAGGLQAAARAARETDDGLEKARREARGLGDDFDRAGREAGDLSGKITGALGGVAAGLGLREVVQGLGATVSAAADLSESVNAINVVLGEGADKFLDFGESAADSLGLTQSALNEAVVPIASLLRNANSEGDQLADQLSTIATRATDTASVFNTDVNQVLEAFGSAIRGEAEPARRFGVNLNAARIEAEALASGLADSSGEVSDAAKVQAAYNLVLEDTAALAGDFANTAESLPNLLRRIGAVGQESLAGFGSGLLEPVRGAAANLLEGLVALRPDLEAAGQDIGEAIAPGLDGAIDATLSLAKVALPALVGAVERTAPLVETLADAFTLAANAAGPLQELLELLPDFGPDLEGLAADLESANEAAQTRALDELATSLRTLQEEARASELTGFAGRLLQFEDLATTILPGVSSQLDRARDEFSTFDDTLAGLVERGQVEQAADLVRQLGIDADTAGQLLPGYTAAVEALDPAADGAAGAAAALAGGIEDTGDEAREAAQEVETLADALDRLIGRQLSVDDATARFQDSLDELTEAAKAAREDGFGPTSDVLDETDAAARGLAGSFRDATGDLLGQVEAAQKAGASNFELARIVREGIGDLRAQGEAAGLTAEQVNTLAARYGLIPEQIITELGLTGADAVIADIERVLGMQARIDRDLGIVVTVPGGGRIPENAADGMIVEPRPGGTLVRVAEAGSREVIVPTDNPARATQLLSAAGLIDVLRPTAVGAPATAGGTGRTAPLIERIVLPTSDPDRAGQALMRTVDDAEFLYGDQGRFG